jgi:long-chain fatty acid transport protein
VNFGAIWKVSDRLSIGGHWLTRKAIDYDGDATFTQVPTGLVLPLGHKIQLPPLCDTLSPCNVDNLPAPFFAPGAPLGASKVSTSLIMPPQGTIGFAYKANDKMTVMMDYQYVVWGWFSEVLIDFENPATPDITLHPSNKDTHGVRTGIEYQYSPKLQLRGGYIYHTGASPSSFVTPLLPEGARHEFTVGAGLDVTPKMRADLGYQYIKQLDRRGTVNTSVGNTGLYQFSAHLFGFGLAYTF